MFGYDEDTLEKARQANEGPIDRDMFGYSASSLNRMKRRGPWWLRAFVIGLEVSVGLAGLFVCFSYWLTTTPEGMRLALTRIIGDAPIAIEVDDVYVHPGTRLLDPQTWNIVVKGLDVQQTDHIGDGVRVQARYAVLPLPNVFSAWFNQRLLFEEALVIGLDITKQEDGIPGNPNWEPKKSALTAIDIEHLKLWDGSFHLDDAGGEASDSRVWLIYGELDEMRYEPGPRLLSGSGSLFAKHFRSGAIEVEHVVADAVAKDGNLVFDASTFTADGAVDIHGTVGHLERRPEVALQVTANNLRIAEMVQRASGTASPVYGRVSGTIEVRSGGDIPRGGAWMEAELRLDHGMIPLEGRINGFLRDLLRLAPWTEINDQEQMVLGDTGVRLRLERGAAIIHELRHQTQNGRYITMHGMVDQEIDLVVRFEPRNNPDTRAGFGFTIGGEPGALRFALARRHELLPSVFADEDGEKLSRQERRQRRREMRQLRRGEPRGPNPG